MADEPIFNRSRLSDPVVMVAAATAFMALVGSYFGIKSEIDSLSVQVARLETEEDTRNQEHHNDWAKQEAYDAATNAALAEERQAMAVLRAELDGILINRESTGKPK